MFLIIEPYFYLFTSNQYYFLCVCIIVVLVMKIKLQAAESSVRFCFFIGNVCVVYLRLRYMVFYEYSIMFMCYVSSFMYTFLLSCKACNAHPSQSETIL